MMREKMQLGELFSEPMPYPDPFSFEEQCVIEEAICVGLERSFQRHPKLRDRPLQEEQITAALEAELCSMMVNETLEGFTQDVFETITRDSALRDYADRPIDHFPDLVLRRKTRSKRGVNRLHHGLFVECKVVDSGRTMKRYVPEGLARFVQGSYAWAVRVALMIAYVDDAERYRLPDTLADYLSAHAAKGLKSDVYSRKSSFKIPVHFTTHERNFVYQDGTAPGAIQVDHLWQRIGGRERG